MKLFSCPACDQVVFFENVACERCLHKLGYDPRGNVMLALEKSDSSALRAVGAQTMPRDWKYCANAAHDVCNWLLPANEEEEYCIACRHNVTVPDYDDAAKTMLWRKMEAAKHRMIYTALRLGLPLKTRNQMEEGLGFAFLSSDPSNDGSVMTGHASGLITIALVEADDAEREKRRTAMGEPYRTLLGHFRHEVGHWYWDRLVRDGGALDECRAVFGDDRRDYGEALKAHYEHGPKEDWRNEHVSSYAGSHPWEDFAETWAHYFHIVDTIETGHSFGVALEPRVANADLLTTSIDFDVYDDRTDIDAIARTWLALSGALNAFARSMGQPDTYPFVLAPTVLKKLGFVHDLVHGRFDDRASA